MSKSAAAEDLAPAFGIRFADARDHNAILSSWLNSYWDDKAPQFRGVSSEQYFSTWTKRVKNLIGHKDADKPNANAIVLVAHDPEAAWHIFSWICGELLEKELLVHYAFTFKHFRKHGVANALLGKLLEEKGDRVAIATHRTRKLKDHCSVNHSHLERWKCVLTPGVLARKGLTFNPYRFET